MATHTLCLDLGHAQTSASMPRLTTVSGTGDKKYTAERLNMEENGNIIPTQLVLTNKQMEFLRGELSKSGSRLDEQTLSRMERETGTLITIGSALPGIVPNGERFAYFKTCPQNFDQPFGESDAAKRNKITCAALMACFAYATVRNILQYNTDKLGVINDRSQICMLVGCPTTGDWTSEEAREEYEKLISAATGITDVRIVPESRAAMFSAVERVGKPISTSNGAIVFDFGSSTADCTYMLMGRKIIEFSWALGAHEIERQMALAAYQQPMTTPQNQGAGIPCDKVSFASAEEEMRRCKEEYFSGKYAGLDHWQVVSFNGAGGSVNGFVNIKDQFMEEMTGNKPFPVKCNSTATKTGSWRAMCKAFLQAAKNEVAQATYTVLDENKEPRTVHCGVDTIVLTGGASKMSFIKELCQEVFPDIEPILDSDPSYTVSNGLAWVALSDEKRADCIQAAKEEVLADQASTLDALKGSLADAMLPYLQGRFQQAAQDWANDPEDLTGQDLADLASEALEKPDAKEHVRQICAEGIENWKEGLSTRIEASVNGQASKLYTEAAARNLIIPQDVWSSLQSGALSVDGFDVDSVIKKLDLSSMATSTIKTITDWSVWIVAAALAIETWGISLLVAAIYNVISDEVWRDRNMKRPRDKRTRGKVSDQIPEVFADPQLKKDLMKAFSASIDDVAKDFNFNSFIDQTITKAFDIVTLREFSL